MDDFAMVTIMHDINVEVFAELLNLWQSFEETRLNNPYFISQFYGKFDPTKQKIWSSPTFFYENSDLYDYYYENLETKEVKTRVTHIGTNPSIFPNNYDQLEKTKVYLFLDKLYNLWRFGEYSVYLEIDWINKKFELICATPRNGLKWAYLKIAQCLKHPEQITDLDRSFLPVYEIFNNLKALSKWSVKITCK